MPSVFLFVSKMAVSGIALLWRENRTYPSVEMDILIVYGELLHVKRINNQYTSSF
jgi:hypothetical protein